MKNFLLGLMGLLPSILQVVLAVETAIGAGNGAAKKALVLNAITAGAKAGESIPNVQIAVVSALIDSVVTDLNASGVLGKPAPLALPAPAAA